EVVKPRGIGEPLSQLLGSRLRQRRQALEIENLGAGIIVGLDLFVRLLEAIAPGSRGRLLRLAPLRRLVAFLRLAPLGRLVALSPIVRLELLNLPAPGTRFLE